MTFAPPPPLPRQSSNRDLEAPTPLLGPFGIYIHIPFCRHICPYCDFNTYSGLENLAPEYVDALCREIDCWAPEFIGREAVSVFIGGGTPSLLAPKLIERLIDATRSAFSLAADAEITVETNPNDLDEAYCKALFTAGINRLSVGGQTFNHRGLRVLGRKHSEHQVHQALVAARAAGFSSINVDLIYGWPGQSLDMWRDDLEKITAPGNGGLVPDHLSLYSLIIEPGTPMADAVARGILTPASDDESADFFEEAITFLRERGWRHYEIANWAGPTGTPSRHNAVYWRNGDYAGIGAGAHGHVQGRRTMNHPAPRRYIELVSEGHSPVSNVERIDPATSMGETMMLGLRLLDKGVSPEAFAKRHGVSLQARFGETIERLSDLGLLIAHDDRVVLTDRGALLANSVCAEFL